MLYHIGSDIVPMAAIVMIFGGAAIQHFVKSLGRAIEARAAQQSGVNAEMREAIAELRREVAALRDTSTQFDMSFDAAITRLESRVDRIEERETTSGASNRTMSASVYDSQSVVTAPREATLGVGRVR